MLRRPFIRLLAAAGAAIVLITACGKPPGYQPSDYDWEAWHGAEIVEPLDPTPDP